MIVEPKNTKNKKPLKNSEIDIDIDSEIDRGRVLQRNTYYKNSSNNTNNNRRSVFKTRGFIISVRLNYNELEMLNFLVEKRRANTSSVIRDAIRVLYGLLSGAKNISTDTVIINNPNVILNVNENKAINNTYVDVEVLEKKIRMLEKQKHDLKELVSFYEKELRKRDEDIKELQEKLRNAESEKRVLEGRLEKIKRLLRWGEEEQDPRILRNILKNIQEVV